MDKKQKDNSKEAKKFDEETTDIKHELVVMKPLTPRQISNSIDMATSMDEKKMFAVEMIQSGLLPETLATPDHLEDDEYRKKAIGAVIAIVEYGRELNISPWVALNGMHVVKGKVVIGVHMYLGLALKNNILVDVVEDYVRIYNKDKKLTDIITTVEITRKYKEYNNAVKVHRFSKRWSEIKKAGLEGRDNYIKRPILMLRTRCITEALRLYAADIFMGIYETTEMLDVSSDPYTVDEDGALKENN
jgi:hypothetical protein